MDEDTDGARLCEPQHLLESSKDLWRARLPSKTLIAHCKNENAEGVPEISRGLSDQRERYPRSTFKRSRTPEGCKNVLFTTPALRPLQGREICLSGFRRCRCARCAQPPANFSHPFRMPERGSASRSTQDAQDARTS